MKIAMAAPFDIKNKRSWSGTPWSLYDGLCSYKDNEIETINLSKYYTEKLKKKNLYSHLDIKETIRQKHPVSALGPAWMNPLNSKILSEVCNKKDYDVLIEFGGYQPHKNLPPYYVYTDASHDLSLDYLRQSGEMPYYCKYSAEKLRRAADFVRPIYQNAAGVFCMSDFLAKSMIETTGVDEKKVHTVYAGANWHGVTLPNIQPKSIENKDTINILLTGVDYRGKGADLAVEAMEVLHQKYGQKYKLHICGVREEIPQSECVINHGFVDKKTLSELLMECDLFVLPSRFDCFGIAFVEAMTYGLPCIGRSICAMPEIIDEGINGELVHNDNPEKLAELIEKICSDSAFYASYSRNAIEKSKRFTWQRVCEDIMNVIRNDME
ncbi:MAG: glycosyltransferase family 4 protein [Clostridia bacterium]|nr:glycosyltransferase family 4 protein [Clostridia bacterium]